MNEHWVVDATIEPQDLSIDVDLEMMAEIFFAIETRNIIGGYSPDGCKLGYLLLNNEDQERFNLLLNDETKQINLKAKYKGLNQLEINYAFGSLETTVFIPKSYDIKLTISIIDFLR